MDDSYSDNIADLSLEKRALLELLLQEEGGEFNSFSLSFAQQRLWFLDQLEPESPFYNIPVALRLSGSLNTSALERSINEVVQRHETLRTTFATLDGNPVQIIASVLNLPLPLTDLSALSRADRTAEAQRLIREEAQRPFLLTKGPLLRATLLRLDQDEHIALLTMHHIVSDGWSMGLLVRELTALYESFCTGQPAVLPELRIQYADFAAWQREWLMGERLERQLAYWRQQLNDVPTLELPCDRMRPPRQSFRGGQQTIVLPYELCQSLRLLSQREGATLFMVLLSAFKVLLYRYTSQDDIVVGTPVAGRTRLETEPLIGFFVNTLALRTRMHEDPTFRQLLARVQEVTLQAYEHQDVPFERVVEELQPVRDLSRQPLFQVMMIWQDEFPERRMQGVLASLLKNESATAKFDLTLLVSERRSELEVSIEYCSDLFDGETIREMVGHYETLLGAIVRGPESRVSRLGLLTEAERGRQLRGEGKEEERGRRRGGEECLQEMFEAQVRRNPEAAALLDHGRMVSYGELNRRANELGHELRRRGVGPESRVGILLERTAELVVGILGVLKAGGAYVPLDGEYPGERLSFMLEDAGVRLLLSEPGLMGKHGEVMKESQAEVFCPGSGWEVEAGDEENPVSEVGGGNLAYLIYTSGSTGRPKAVAIEHQSVVALMEWGLENFSGEELEGVLFSTSICFDLSVFELFMPLSSGGAVVIARDALELVELAERSAVTLVNTVPSAMSELVRLRAVPGSVRSVNLAGEVLSEKLVEQVYGIGSVKRVRNLYGPSEDTTYTTCAELRRGGKGAPLIGGAIKGTEVYVLDGELEPVPVGVYGELYIGGAGVARGYQGRAELTAEKFIPDPFGVRAGGRLYRTGDLGRYRRSGELEYQGRRDQQVKVRGYRIEMGEIEAALERQAGVAEAVVIVREGADGDKQLVGCIVAGEETRPTSSALRKELRAKLPEYMVPGQFKWVREMPRTANGKVDRRALAAMSGLEPAAAKVFVGARSLVEEMLSEIFAQVLGRELVSIEENFFELGGHSLLATRVIARVRDWLQVELPLRSLFENPTVVELAQIIETELNAGVARAAMPLHSVSRDRDLPLSFAQQRLWFLDQLVPGNPTYNLSVAVRLRGDLDAATLEQNLNQLVERHESLRTTFVVKEGEPMQVIATAMQLTLLLYDLSVLAESELEVEMERLISEDQRRAFDLQRGPLLRVSLVRLAAQDHVMLLTMHHIISDGWSMGVLWRELSVLYGAASRGERATLSELPVQYADYAVWQREWLKGEVLETQLSYWRQKLDGTPLLEMPSDKPRPRMQNFRGATQMMVFDQQLSERLTTLSRRKRVTLFMTLLAVFKVMLSRYTGQSDIVVGTPTANRNRFKIEGLIGFFLNTLVLRTDLSGEPTFSELLDRVREVTLGAYAHQDVPFEKLLEELQPERDLSRTPFFQVFFNMLNFPLDEIELPGLNTEILLSREAWSKFDVTLYVEDKEGRIRFTLVYNADIFKPARMVEMMEQFKHLASQVVMEPDRKIGQYSLLTPAAASVLPNPTEELSPKWEGAVHTLFSSHARRTPDQLAVIDHQKIWTYRELDLESNRLANYLIASGVLPGDVVAIYGHRSASLVWALLAVLKAGAAFVILDPAYPPVHLMACLKLAMPSAWLQLGGAGKIPEVLADFLGTSACHCRLVLSDQAMAGEHQLISKYSGIDPNIKISPDDLAYIAFTSGTTGSPKGIQGRHGPLTHFVPWLADTFNLKASDRYSMVSGLSHDPLHRDVFTPLTLGATICIPDQTEIETPGELAQWMRRERVSIAHLTPAMAQLLTATIDESDCTLNSLRYAFLVGDVLTMSDVKRLRKLAPSLTCVNYYGTTETQRAVGYFVVRNGPADDLDDEAPWAHAQKEVLPLGRGIKDVQLLVLNDAQQLAGCGELAEIYVRSPHLARGYLGDEAGTRERFIQNPFTETVGDRLYRTGDLGRYSPEGDVEPLGRADFQVKVRGFRVELKEIEAVLATHHDVRTAVVLLREDVPDDKRLVAYVVGRAAQSATAGELRAYLKERLPEYMVPGTFLMLDEMPITPNGKLDRRALPAPDQTQAQLESSFVAPRNGIEETLAAICAEVLGIGRVGIYDNFFALGGHSLLVIQVLARVRKSFQVEVSPREMFESPTVAHLALVVVQLQVEQAGIDATDQILTALEQLSEEESTSMLADRTKPTIAV
jgi:amino acid adenylation domain-containing protein